MSNPVNAIKMETPYYLGGYYVLKPKSLGPEYNEGNSIHTTSCCFSEPLVDSWAYSWGNYTEKELAQVKADFQLNDKAVKQIQAWTDEKFELNQLQWVNNFHDLDIATEYKETFFSHRNDVHIYSIYLSAADSDSLVAKFENEENNHGDFGLRKTLLHKMIEEQENPNEVLLGYDLIGVELDGNYHTFYCHYAAQKLSNMFGLSLNTNGLFEEINDWQPVKDYINIEGNGFEPVPWYVAKTKVVML